MEISQLRREFKYNSVKLPDPNPAFSLTQVRDFFANVYPEIISADIEGPVIDGDKHTYNFRRAVGTKGAASRAAKIRKQMIQQLRETGTLSSSPRPACAITMKQAHQPLALRIETVLRANAKASPQRWLAPSANQTVLP
jgi:PRTRC genetic system protein C